MFAQRVAVNATGVAHIAKRFMGVTRTYVERTRVCIVRCLNASRF